MLSVMLNKHIQNWNDCILTYYNDSEFPYVMGLEIKASQVHSICPGKVISVSNWPPAKQSVSVMVNNNQIVRYANLSSVQVKEGQEVTFRTVIGTANKFVRFEYCTVAQHSSKWPVRIKSLTVYKQDPTSLLTGDIKLEVVVDNIHEATGEEDMIYLDKYVLDEFTGSRGDD